MTDKEFFQLDPEALLKKYQALQKKRTRVIIPSNVNIRSMFKNEHKDYYQSYLESFYQEDLNEWYPVKSCLFPDQEPRDLDHFDEGHFDQPSPDIYSQVKSEIIREKVSELLHLFVDFYTQTMLDSFDNLVDEIIALFMMKIFWEVTKR